MECVLFAGGETAAGAVGWAGQPAGATNRGWSKGRIVIKPGGRLAVPRAPTVARVPSITTRSGQAASGVNQSRDKVFLSHYFFHHLVIYKKFSHSTPLHHSMANGSLTGSNFEQLGSFMNRQALFELQQSLLSTKTELGLGDTLQNKQRRKRWSNLLS